MKNSEGLNLMDIIMIVKKHFVKIIAVAVVCAIVSGVYTTFFVQPRYTSSMKWVVINKSHGEALTIYDVQMSSLLIGDCIEVIKSRDLMETIIDSLDIRGMSPGGLAGCITISSPTDTRTLEIVISDVDPVRVKRIADELFSKGGPLIEQKLDVKQIEMIESPLIPSYPSSPNAKRNAVMGGLAGAIIVVGILIIAKITSNKLTTIDEIESELGVTVLASIPKSGVQGRKNVLKTVFARRRTQDSTEG